MGFYSFLKIPMSSGELGIWEVATMEGWVSWGRTGRWLSDGLRQITFVLSSLKNKKSLLLGLIIKAQSIWSGFCQSMKVHGFWVWQKTWLFEVYCPFQFISVAQSCPTLCDPMNCSTPGLSVHHQLPEFTQTQVESVMPSTHPILSCPLLLLPPVPPSIRVFSNESTLHMRCPKYWRFSFSIIPSKEIPGLITFRMDWLDLLAVQGTLKSLLQHHSSKASILQC